MSMIAKRRDVWLLEADENGWSDTMVWYAKAVAHLQTRPLAQRTSWRFLAAMHNFDPDMWTAFGYLSDDDTPPDESDIKRFWAKCEHWNWYFLPWHRGYLSAFERIVRAAIVELGGPDGWALPYWNYNNKDLPHPRRIPPCFLQPTLPDGQPNALHVHAGTVVQRFGLDAQGNMMNVDEERISDRKALLEPFFVGEGHGGSGGFGGVPGDIGEVEKSPHNHVHTRIGGVSPAGLMSATETAGLDPIFWLHHANIDRLWEVWLRRDPEHENPGEKEWLKGPSPPFAMPGVDGSVLEFNPEEMRDTRAPWLDYEYEDVTDPLSGARKMERRLLALGVPADRLIEFSETEKAMPRRPTIELLGANDRVLHLEGLETTTSVEIDGVTSRKLARSFDSLRVLGDAPREPDRVFLNLENVRGRRDAMVLDVYLDLPDGADPAAHPEARVGSLSLFGLRMASRIDAPHGGNGLNLRIEITDYIDANGLDPERDLDQLKVRIVAEAPIEPEDEITIGRISLYRQGD
jgi:tyrosinase